jgi:hypothetical protein
MTEPQTDLTEHPHFDNLCAGVEDYEPLPELVPGPADTIPGLGVQGHDEGLDAEILAGLVSP